MESIEPTLERQYRNIEGDRAACVDEETFVALGDPDLLALRDDPNSERGEVGTNPRTIFTRSNQLWVVLEIDPAPFYECRRYFLNLMKEWEVAIDLEDVNADKALRWIAGGQHTVL